MAKRYSGDLQISLRYDDRNFYPVSISRGGKRLWRGSVRPAPAGFGRGVAYDSARAYDQIAESALAFADDERSGIADHAELDESGYKIRRVPRYWQQYPAGSSRRPRFAKRDPERELTGLPRSMMTMARNAAEERGAGAEVHVANPREKRAVEALEKKGLVSVRRTKERIAGLTEWWYRATPKGLGSRDQSRRRRKPAPKRRTSKRRTQRRR